MKNRFLHTILSFVTTLIFSAYEDDHDELKGEESQKEKQTE